MNQLITAVIVVSLLTAPARVGADDRTVASTRPVTYTAFSHPIESLRVSGSNDIYRDKIRDLPLTFDAAGVGFHPYDLDTWARVSSGPIIGSYRSRMYSLFATPFGDPALNALTMRSEDQRRNAGSSDASRRFSSYAGWRF
jgi:hypothetical protein